MAAAAGKSPRGGSWWSVTIVSIPSAFSSAMVSAAEVPLSTETTTCALRSRQRSTECGPKE